NADIDTLGATERLRGGDHQIATPSNTGNHPAAPEDHRAHSGRSALDQSCPLVGKLLQIGISRHVRLAPFTVSLLCAADDSDNTTQTGGVRVTAPLVWRETP